ncbi:hypothetical protein N7492_009702 [Penicillium capsulatum]|uniref:Uncharacterized protein n=1 Tax=Penicillium capsulatum TaxID=69766 RepID=A0A9W9LFI2_9EURO|nr:hypothetical protein N7492_009702 [Penicillium capsulatum]KAJ6114217.1 hypothetical protein N7512_007662 [Penicillium capsulatum]
MTLPGAAKEIKGATKLFNGPLARRLNPMGHAVGLHSQGPSAAVGSPESSTFQREKQQDTVPLTGDVYVLNLQDIQDITESGQISGAIWLTDTYGVNTTSFVTIPVSNELTDRLILHRPLAAWDQPPN